MATKIRRCLYIGLGGTGMKALLHTKKMFIDTYGEVPPMIGFLGIDTDKGEYSKQLLSVRGEVVKLEPHEQLQLLAPGAVEFYKNHKSDFSWVPECNVNAIPMLCGLGAGGVRSNGRFAFTVNKNKVATTVNAKIADITNAGIAHDSKYELLANSLPEIHMVFSVSGGTGCGTFLNMAYLIQNINPAYKTTGYAVLPGVFKALPACAHAVPNAYGALVDLDYLMHHGLGNTPVELKYISESFKLEDKPFANVMFIDNENDNFDHYDNVGELAEMISLALVTAAGQLSVAGNSIGDNFNQFSREGTLDILNKKAWAGGMGACEIVYRGNTLADIYKYKATINIIDRMFNTCDDANVIANAWIDSANVRIRENNGQDHVTDFIAPKEPHYALILDKANYKDPISAVNPNIEANKIKSEDIDSKTTELIERVRTELRNLLVANINKECGVALAKDILEYIRAQIGLCLGEMKQEKEDLTKKRASLKTNLEAAVADLKNAGIWTKKDPLAADVVEATRQYNICLIDIQRHDAAITFYNSVLVILGENETRMANIESLLRAVKQDIQLDIAKLQNGLTSKGSIFQINLAEEDAKSISVKSDDILFSEFIDSLEGNFKVYGFTDYSAKEVQNFIFNFTKNLRGAKSYDNRGVEEVLEDIYKKDPARLENIIQLAARKSLPLFRFQDRGQTTATPLIDVIYVGVNDNTNSILKRDDLFERSLPQSHYLNATRDVDFASIGMRDKIIIYHQIGIVPAYCISDIYDYRKLYESATRPGIGYHFDADIYARMDDEKYDIEPRKRIVDDDEILDLWVKGFIYGLLKNDKGTYYIKSKSLGGLPGKQYWVALADRRTDAFKLFSEKSDKITKDFTAYFENQNITRGAAAIAELFADAKGNELNNYYEKYSQINLTMPTLQSRPYDDVWTLYNEELAHLENL